MRAVDRLSLIAGHLTSLSASSDAKNTDLSLAETLIGQLLELSKKSDEDWTKALWNFQRECQRVLPVGLDKNQISLEIGKYVVTLPVEKQEAINANVRNLYLKLSSNLANENPNEFVFGILGYFLDLNLAKGKQILSPADWKTVFIALASNEDSRVQSIFSEIVTSLVSTKENEKFLLEIARILPENLVSRLVPHLISLERFDLLLEVFSILSPGKLSIEERNDLGYLVATLYETSSSKLPPEQRKELILACLRAQEKFPDPSYPFKERTENIFLMIMNKEKDAKCLEEIIRAFPKEGFPPVSSTRAPWTLGTSFTDFEINLFSCVTQSSFSLEEKLQLFRALLESGVPLIEGNQRNNFLEKLLGRDEYGVKLAVALVPMLPLDFLNYAEYEDISGTLLSGVLDKDDLSSKKKKEVLKALVARGVDVLIEVDGETILNDCFDDLRKVRLLQEVISPKDKEKLLKKTFKDSLFLQVYYDRMISQSKRIERIGKLARNGHDPSKLTKDGYSLLHVLALHCDTECLREVLTPYSQKQRRDFLSVCTQDGEPVLVTLIFNAIFSNQKKIKWLQMFETMGGDLFQIHRSGANILYFLAAAANSEILAWVLQRRSKEEIKRLINATDIDGNSVIHCVDVDGDFDDSKHIKPDMAGTLQLLISYGANVLAQNKEGRTFLHRFMQSLNEYEAKDIPKVLTTLSRHPDCKTLVNTPDSNGDTPLFCGYSVSSSSKVNEVLQRHILRWFVRRGVDLSHKNGKGSTILSKMEQTGNAFTEDREVFLWMLDPNQRQILIEATAGSSSLLQAYHGLSSDARERKIEVLIREGVDVLGVDSEGKNILRRLVESNHNRLALLLLEHTSPERMEILVNHKDLSGENVIDGIFDNEPPYHGGFQAPISFPVPSDRVPLIAKLAEFLDIENYSFIKINKLFIESILGKETCIPITKVLENKLQGSFITISQMMEYLEQGGDSTKVAYFLDFIKGKKSIYHVNPTLDQETKDLFNTYIRCYEDLQYLRGDIKMNDVLCLSPQGLEMVAELSKRYRSSPYFESVRVGVQTCGDRALLTRAAQGLDRKLVYDRQSFLRLPLEEQKTLLSRYVVFRDRKGLELVSFLLEEASRDHSLVSSELVSLALELIEKTEIVAEQDRDENSLVHLICALMLNIGSQPTEHTSALLAKAVFSLAKIDRVRFQNQYRHGIFEAFKMAKQLGQTALINQYILALGSYSYSQEIPDDLEIIQALVQYAKEPNLSSETKRALADVLASMRQEEALLTAWEIIRGSIWDDHYGIWNHLEERFDHGSFNMFPSRPFAIHDNRNNMRKKILDILGQCDLKARESVEEVFAEFKKNPEKYPSIQKHSNYLRNLPEGFENADPLYLPTGSFIFRGISCRKGVSRASDALLDLLERGIGNSELTRAVSEQSTFAKIGHFFCAMDSEYSRGYVDNNGAFIVIKGDYANKCIEQRRVRQQKQGNSFHYIFYDTIGHEHIHSIHVHKSVVEELKKLRDADLETLNRSELKHFGYFEKDELKRFVLFLRNDPYKLFEKLRAHEDVRHADLKVAEVTREQLEEENIKRFILRGLMAKKYEAYFGVAHQEKSML